MYAIYPAKKMRISQRYDEGNHLAHFNNTDYKDYPIDETYGSSASTGSFYAPFDCEVVKKYSATTKEIWITSTSKVDTPLGNDYVTVFIGHIRSSEYDNIQVGDKYKQYEKIVSEEKDSMSTGYHNHISAGLGKMKGSGWIKNNRGLWVPQTTNGMKKPELIFYVDKSFTTIINDKGLNFQDMPKHEVTPELPETPTEYITYKIKKGDTLSEIAQEYGTTVSTLARINNIKDVDKIYAGNTLKIPTNNSSYIEYKIKRGDTLSEIAKKYGTTVKKLQSINGIKNANKIYAGDTIKIPK